MSSAIKTTHLGLNQWVGTEYPARQDFVDDNKKIDDKFIEVDSQLGEKANVDDVNIALTGKANSTHNHTVSNITGLQDALNAKAPLVNPTFTGTAKATGNTNYTTEQIRNAYFTATVPTTLTSGSICFVYE